MSTYEVDQVPDHAPELRYDMGYTSYPVPTDGMASHGVNYNHEYDWTHPQDGAYSARGMYPVSDVMDPSTGSYMGYPSVPQPDIGVLPTPTYIPSGEMSFATPLSHMPYNGQENFYGQAYCSISPTSTASNSSGGSTGSGNTTQKPKRKRVQNHHQRKAANVRERRRMFHLNEAFDELRKRLPAFNYEKRLSRIETLRLAMTYIAFMKDVSDGQEPDHVPLLQIQRKSEQFSDEAESE